MNQVDWSYLKYPEHSYGRVLGRRKEAKDMAVRIHGTVQVSYFQICIGELNRMCCNNWRKMHGIPMRRKRK